MDAPLHGLLAVTHAAEQIGQAACLFALCCAVLPVQKRKLSAILGSATLAGIRLV